MMKYSNVRLDSSGSGEKMIELLIEHGVNVRIHTYVIIVVSNELKENVSFISKTPF